MEGKSDVAASLRIRGIMDCIQKDTKKASQRRRRTDTCVEPSELGGVGTDGGRVKGTPFSSTLNQTIDNKLDQINNKTYFTNIHY